MIFLDESCVYLFLFITVTELYTKEQRAILAAITDCKTKEGKSVRDTKVVQKA